MGGRYLTTKEAAEMLGISPQHLCEAVRGRTGAGKAEYISLLTPCRGEGRNAYLWPLGQVKRAMRLRRKKYADRRRVYFILCLYPDGAKYVKVGIASRVRARLSAMHTAHPKSVLSLLAEFSPVEPTSARDVERSLHSLLAEHRSREGGEWFEYGPAMDLLNQLKKNPQAFQLKHSE